MQLDRVRVEGLFGRFTYDIAFRRPERITIIHAPNGFGKTAILTLIDAFFSGEFFTFFKYNFKSLLLQFDNREAVEIRRDGPPSLFDEKDKEKEKEQEASEIEILLQSPMRKGDRSKFKWKDTIPALNRFVGFLRSAGPDQWYDDNTDTLITTKEAIARYSGYLPPKIRQGLELPEWLTSFVGSSDC